MYTTVKGSYTTVYYQFCLSPFGFTVGEDLSRAAPRYKVAMKGTTSHIPLGITKRKISWSQLRWLKGLLVVVRGA